MRRIETKHHPLAAAARTAAAAIAALAVIACLATACSNDDDRDPAAGLDPTTQPLIFTATVAAPTTAVATPTTRANTAASQWTDGDEVAVEMNGVVKKYIIKAAAGATASLRPADAANTHYVPNGSFTVRAWRYGHTMPFTENFDWNRKPDKWYTIPAQDATSDGESHYQQSDFLYAPELTVGNSAVSGSSIGLRFYHQTARVVVNIREAGAVKAENKEKISVILGGPVDATPESSCNLSTLGTFNAGLIDHYQGKYSGLEADVTAETSFVRAKPIVPANEGYACSFEALVIPQNMSGQKFIQVNIPKVHPDNPTSPETGIYYYTPDPGEANLLGGYTYTYDIIVSKDGTLDVTVATPIAGWENQGEGGSGTVEPLIPIDLDNPPTINDNGMYLLTGTKNGMTLDITGGNPTVIVRDVEIVDGSIHITGGTPEIKVEGTKNEITSSNYGPPIWLDGENANVRITGKGINESRLMLGVEASYPHAVIGTEGTFQWINLQCGNIEISNLTLHADAAVFSIYKYGGAAIGTGGGWGNRKCGNIFIADAYINASSADGAAVIGFGSAEPSNDMTGTWYEMGDITILNSTIESEIGKGANGIYPAHIGSGSVMAETYKIGNITINTNKSGPEFFGKFDGGTKSDDEMIVGFPGNVKSWRILWNNPDGLFISGINWSMVH